MVLDEAQIKELLSAADEAATFAYAPYSRFPVGAIIMLKDRTRFAGANIENASYPVGICAERAAMARVIMEGRAKEIALVVVTTPTEKPGTPCGMCRQFLSEFLAADTPIIYGNRRGDYEVISMAALLPHAFCQHDLAAS